MTLKKHVNLISLHVIINLFPHVCFSSNTRNLANSVGFGECNFSITLVTKIET